MIYYLKNKVGVVDFANAQGVVMFLSPRWEIFMEQELRFGLDLGQMANFPAFIASKSYKYIKPSYRYIRDNF